MAVANKEEDVAKTEAKDEVVTAVGSNNSTHMVLLKIVMPVLPVARMDTGLEIALTLLTPVRDPKLIPMGRTDWAVRKGPGRATPRRRHMRRVVMHLQHTQVHNSYYATKKCLLQTYTQ